MIQPWADGKESINAIPNISCRINQYQFDPTLNDLPGYTSKAKLNHQTSKTIKLLRISARTKKMQTKNCFMGTLKPKQPEHLVIEVSRIHHNLVKI